VDFGGAMPSMTVLLDYVELTHAKNIKFCMHFSKISPIIPAFCSLLFTIIFFQKIASKVGTALETYEKI